MKILIVEPDKTTQQVFSSLLEEYEIQTVNCGQEALDTLQKDFYDLVITNDRLADFSGLQLLSEIKSMHPQTEVLMIGVRADETEQEALKLGVFRYIEKPIPGPRFRNWVEVLASRERCPKCSGKMNPSWNFCPYDASPL